MLGLDKIKHQKPSSKKEVHSLFVGLIFASNVLVYRIKQFNLIAIIIVGKHKVFNTKARIFIVGFISQQDNSFVWIKAFSDLKRVF
jgi:hypothetical protein